MQGESGGRFAWRRKAARSQVGAWPEGPAHSPSAWGAPRPVRSEMSHVAPSLCFVVNLHSCKWKSLLVSGSASRRSPRNFPSTASVHPCLLTPSSPTPADLVLQNYFPSKQDILLARKATKGIVEHDFVIKKIPFKMVDVGGQRSQRQKWFQCFDGITSILFMVSSSEYDQVLMEDRRTNRLVESMNIFETIVNNKLFFNVSIILFLNKMDLLVEKVKTVSIKKHFPDFKGDPHRLEDVQRFLVQCFDRKRRNRSKPLFHHFTTAIDTENIRFVFHAVKDTILQENLKDIMLQ